MVSEITAVSISETGMEYRTPSSPKNTGSKRAKPTPNIISLTIESIVDAIAFPIACRKIKAALLMQAKIIRQR